MDASRWNRVQPIVDAASELPTDQRKEFLHTACGSDAELRTDVESMLATLATLANQTDYVGASVRDSLHSEFQSLRGLEAGSMAGPYRLIRKIGEGGMAAVYLASRADQQFERQVAIKFIRPEMAAGQLFQRFRVERQILAGLEHPNIARMLDGGLTENGAPYLVMEYVEGVPIDQYCREQKLPLREIVELFRAVCAALEYAHRNLIVHRDVKPSNILVTREGVPKLLDFGIAKLLNDAANEEDLTRPTQRFMTMEYASPEQVMGEPVTTATDVYSLGLVLYELLTASRPFQGSQLGPLELQKRICLTDPPRPSSIPRDRTIARVLTGDLDNIVLMAVRKEPKNRYGSVEQFSDDLRAWLNGFPVAASKGTTRYRAVKFVQRHRVSVAVAVLFVTLLAGFSFAMGALALRLARERNIARQERQRATQVSGFLTSLFEGADPYRAKGAELTARDLLEEGWSRVSRSLEDQPEVRGEILQTMAEAYEHLGDQARAQQLFTAELEARRRAYGPRSAEASRALRQLGDVERARADLVPAETHLREALGIQEAVLRPGDEELSHTINNLGLVLQERGKLAEARDLFQRAVGISSHYPAQRPQTLTMMSNLGGVLSDLGDLDASEKVLRDVLVQRQAILGAGHPQIPRSINRLAHTLELKGSYGEAEKLYRLAASAYAVSLPEDHPDRLTSLSNLARVLQIMRRYGEAEALYRQAIAAGQETLGDRLDVALWQSNLASLLGETGRTREAERLYQDSLAVCRKKLGPDNRREAQMLVGLGKLYAGMGEYAKAGANLNRALAIDRAKLGGDDPRTAEALFQLAMLRKDEKQAAEAIALAREALEIDGKRPPTIDTSRHLLGLAELLRKNHDTAAAEPLAKQSLDLRMALLPADSWQVKEARDAWNAARETAR